MERKTRLADAILGADFHLREDTPICRTDNYWEAQWKKVKFIHDLAKEHECYLLVAGDLFEYWKPSPFLLSTTLSLLPKYTYAIYGQHDLPQHSLEFHEKNGMEVLKRAGNLTILPGVHFGQTPENNPATLIIKDRKILVWHTFNYIGKTWPGNTAPTSHTLLDKYQEYDLILTGDNHQTIVVSKDGRLLVNPGSMMRMDADQINHRPCVFLWYANTNTIKPVFLPIETGVITREHIEKVEERDSRLQAFVSRLNEEWDVGISFEENIERFIANNRLRQGTINVIRKSMEK